jgi:hypothetical protein
MKEFGGPDLELRTTDNAFDVQQKSVNLAGHRAKQCDGAVGVQQSYTSPLDMQQKAVEKSNGPAP